MPPSSSPERGIRAAATAPALDAVRARAPEGVPVLPIDDGLDLDAVDFLIPAASDADVVQRLPGLSHLSVVQVLSAGIDWIEHHVPPQAVLCSARGARDAPVAEWIMGALLGATTQLLECARITTWSGRRLTDLSAWTVVIVGMGSIGQRVHEHLTGFGSTVIGVASRARDDVHGISELHALLPAADAVVVLAPLTDGTRGLIGARELAAMRDGALLINAARGPVVDTEALLAEVTTGRLRAVLDVTDPEPLPDGHPLWTARGVLSITPHIAGDSPAGNARAAEFAGEQLVRWCAGEELRNVVRAGTG